jgi:UDP-N-acetylmuramoylalanine--D-glutamate ligase
MNTFQHKKIGIWGFGIVGQSALTYFDTLSVESIEILDAKKIILPPTKNIAFTTEQNDASIIHFLERNDFILTSPGIKLHAYNTYNHKFINELDIFANHKLVPTIAITGTVGKTSITHLLTKIIQNIFPHAQAAGNIGYPLLNFVTYQDRQCNFLVIELSSFQLQFIKQFAPDLAIITNFFSNHLDHHQTIDEYFQAKCNILRYQTDKDQALLPMELAEKIEQVIPRKLSWAFFSTQRPDNDIVEKYAGNTIFYADEKKIYSIHNTMHTQIFDTTHLPAITYDANWLIIVAACAMLNIPLANILDVSKNMDVPDYRLQKVGSYKEIHFYNDSKSTVWQATLQATQALEKLPIKLFVGGLSKGADRRPLFEKLQNKNVQIYAFGKEAQIINQLCLNFKISCQAYQTLDAAWNGCISSIISPCNVLFSPGGSSFDLFIDYQDRGKYFTKLVMQYLDSKN